MRTRIYCALLAALQFGCVKGAEGFSAAALPRPPSGAEADRARTLEVKQPFPDETRLKELTSQPAADPSVGLGEAPAKVDRWTLSGPLPGIAGVSAFTSTDPERMHAVEVVAKQRSDLRTTAAMMCVAQEYATFVATNGRTPPVDVRMFIAGRCGTTVAELRFRVMRASQKLTPRRFLADGAQVRKILSDVPEQGHVGLGWADHDGQRFFASVGGRPDVEIEPVELDITDASPVVLRGRVQWPIEWLSAHVTRGELGFDRCAPLSGAGGRDGEFALECSVDSKDPLAFIEIYAAPRGALMGRPVLTLAVSPDGSGPLEYVALVHALPVDDDDRRPEALVAGLNAVRERAKRDPLQLSTAQSTVANNLFAHLQGQTELGVCNEIALGIMAGWQVEGTIREGSFKVSPASREWTLERLIAGSLASPSFRAAALDPDADVVAIGQVESASSDVRGVLWATYDMFEPSDFEAEEEMLLEALDAQRAAAGLEPVVRLEGRTDREVLEESARRIRTREATPLEELDDLLQHFVKTQQRGFGGVVLAPMRIEGWRPEFPADLLQTDGIAVATMISYYEPEGAAWGQHVVMLVYSSGPGTRR